MLVSRQMATVCDLSPEVPEPLSLDSVESVSRVSRDERRFLCVLGFGWKRGVRRILRFGADYTTQRIHVQFLLVVPTLSYAQCSLFTMWGDMS